MQVKLFEVRDKMTYIPCFGISLNDGYGQTREEDRRENHLLGRAGFGIGQTYVIFGSLEDTRKCEYDPFRWTSLARTMPTAHRYIIEHWSELGSGAVIDVEFILGETLRPKDPEA